MGSQKPDRCEICNSTNSGRIEKLQETDATVIYDKTQKQLYHDENSSSLTCDGKDLDSKDLFLEASKKRRSKSERSNVDIIYHQAKGHLFYDANGEEGLWRWRFDCETETPGSPATTSNLD